MKTRNDSESLLQEGKNCWRLSHIDRLTFLIDSVDYYQAFFEVSQKARTTLHISGWEIDARMVINPQDNERSMTLRQYLNSLAEHLMDIHLLTWKAPPYLRFGRERFSFLKWKILASPKICYSNNRFPYIFGSYHEKIAIVDQKCAFMGGIDFAKRRWDTHEHLGNSDIRKDLNGKHYHPIHDVQFILCGNIIKDLEEFMQKRSEKNIFLSQQSDQGHAIWPDSFSPELQNVVAGISRTEAQSKDFEIENLYLDAIRNARDFILIENQYFSHHLIIDELAKKLEAKDGPEVVVILPYYYRGKFERAIYVSQRNIAIKRLKSHDRYNRFKIYYPYTPVNDQSFIVVHSKFMIVDGKLMTMGSANLNYRSMRVDREINLTLESGSQRETGNYIVTCLSRVMAEHLDVEVLAFQKTFTEENSLIKTIETFKDQKAKTLKEIPILKIPRWINFLNFLYPIVDLKMAIPKTYAYWGMGGILIFLLVAAGFIDGP